MTCGRELTSAIGASLDSAVCSLLTERSKLESMIKTSLMVSEEESDLLATELKVLFQWFQRDVGLHTQSPSPVTSRRGTTFPIHPWHTTMFFSNNPCD